MYVLINTDAFHSWIFFFVFIEKCKNENRSKRKVMAWQIVKETQNIRQEIEIRSINK